MKAAALAISACVMASVGATGALAAEPGASCPSGAVCIYPKGDGFAEGRPSHAFFSFGAHNIKNQFGVHAVVNNQVDRARAFVCTSSNGKGDCKRLPDAGATGVDLTPINSFLLVPEDRSGRREAV